MPHNAPMHNHHGPIAEYLTNHGFPTELVHTGGNCHSLQIAITESPDGPVVLLGMIDPDSGCPSEDSAFLTVEDHPGQYGPEWSANYPECETCAATTRITAAIEDVTDGIDNDDIAPLLIPYLVQLAKLHRDNPHG